MKWIQAKVVFNFDDKQLTTDLISNIFFELGLKGVVEESPDIERPEDWGEDAITPEHYAIIGYFSYDEKIEKRCRMLEKNLSLLEKKNGIVCKVAYSDIDEVDWTQVWKANFWPEKITANIVVKPTWRKYFPVHDDIVLEIDPGMAFGTGTHPTTRMCITMIEKYLKKGGTFLDVGTGSGILMVLAAKLGASKVWGTENDDVAVHIAQKNLTQNQITTPKSNVITGNLVEKVAVRFDLVAANLTKEAIFTLLDDVKRVLAKNGIFICSGILTDQKGPVLQKMAAMDFDVIEMLSEGNWVSMACRVESSGRPNALRRCW